MDKSEFLIKKMDCPSEKSMIEMKLSALIEIKALNFNIPDRKLIVYHEGGLDKIERNIQDLNFNSSLLKTEKTEIEAPNGDISDKQQSVLLWKVLIINFSFFTIEIITGFISGSIGLVADSLDMLADAFIYGLSLFAIGETVFKKKKIAKWSGLFQIAITFFGIIETIRRFIGYEAIPDFKTMISVSVLALIANVICLLLLVRSKSQEVHIKASMIITSNDVIINAGVILAGLFVYLTNSKYPDLIIGLIVFIIVLQSAFSILKLAK